MGTLRDISLIVTFFGTMYLSLFVLFAAMSQQHAGGIFGSLVLFVFPAFVVSEVIPNAE